MMEMIQADGNHVCHTDNQCEHSAIIDCSTVWCGKDKREDNLLSLLRISEEKTRGR